MGLFLTKLETKTEKRKILPIIILGRDGKFSDC